MPAIKTLLVQQPSQHRHPATPHPARSALPPAGVHLRRPNRTMLLTNSNKVYQQDWVVSAEAYCFVNRCE